MTIVPLLRVQTSMTLQLRRNKIGRSGKIQTFCNILVLFTDHLNWTNMEQLGLYFFSLFSFFFVYVYFYMYILRGRKDGAPKFSLFFLSEVCKRFWYAWASQRVGKMESELLEWITRWNPSWVGLIESTRALIEMWSCGVVEQAWKINSGGSEKGSEVVS